MTKGFPEDYHSGAYDSPDKGDSNDAASFGAHNFTALPTAALIDGCTFDPNFTNDVTDISGGTVRLVGENVDGLNETWGDVAFVYEIDGATGLPLAADSLNHVYVEGDTTSNDTANFVINTTGPAPAGPSVKIGEIDTSNDTTSEQWNLLTHSGQLSFPDESAALEASNTLGDGFVHVRADNEYYKVT